MLARIVAPLGTGAAFYLLAAVSLALTRSLDSIAAIWPSNGVLLAALLLAPREAAWRHVTAAGLASLAANLLAGGSTGLAAAFTTANLGEAMLAAWLLQRRGGAAPSFVEPRHVGRFCVATGLASAVSTVLSTILSGTLTLGFATSWLAADLLGLLIVTPIILVWADLHQARRDGRALRLASPGTMLPLAAVAAVAVLTFAQTDYPLLFLPLLALLAATYRLGPFGATTSVLLIALVGSVLTGFGTGPVTFVQGGGHAGLFFFQFYLLALLISALPLAALLATRDRLHRALTESNRMLGEAEQAAQVGHWRLDAVRSEVFWSPEVFRIHGLPIGLAPSLAQAIGAYHPDDRPAVTAAVQNTMATGTPFSVEARIVRPDGAIRHVVSQGWMESRDNQQPRAVFGVIQDATDHVEARCAAERQAVLAAHLAETDPLTGLPNRRYAMQRLDAAIEDARASGLPFSVVMLDVDHFKGVNDRFGHAVGDHVLQRVAKAAQDALSAGDVVGRLGGEEFILLLPGSGSADALATAERVRAAVAAGGSGPLEDPKVTASLGVATFAGEDASALLSRADRALYEAKNAGRNSLHLAA